MTSQSPLVTTIGQIIGIGTDPAIGLMLTILAYDSWKKNCPTLLIFGSVMDELQIYHFRPTKLIKHSKQLE